MSILLNFRKMLEEGIAGQKRTGKAKQFVIFYQDRVFKGPYRENRMSSLFHRSSLLLQHEVPLIVHPLRLEDENETQDVLQNYPTTEGPFVEFPNLAAGYEVNGEMHRESYSGLQYRVLVRQGVVKLNDALKKDIDWPLEPEHVTNLMIALIWLYILETGDTGFFNVLVDLEKHLIHVIDYDETATEDRVGNFFYLSRPPNKKVAKKWLAAVKPVYPELREYFTDLKEKLPKYRERIEIALQKLQMADQNTQAPDSDAEEVLSDDEADELPFRTQEEVQKMTIAQLKEALTAAQLSFATAKVKKDYVTIYLDSLDGSSKYAKRKEKGKAPKPGLIPKRIVTPPRGPIGKMEYKGGRQPSITYSGYATDVMKSMLQKCIRRGITSEALKAGYELYRMIEVDPTGGIQTNLYNRLAVILAEDIGPANYPLMLTLLDFLGKNDKDRHSYTLAMMIQLMCESTKTRVMSHYWNVYTQPDCMEKAMEQGLTIDTDFTKADKALMKEAAKELNKFWKAGDPSFIQGYANMFYLRLKERDPRCFTWLKYYLDAIEGEAGEDEEGNVTKSKKVKVTARNRRTDPMIVIWSMMSHLMDPTAAKILQAAYFRYSEKRPFLQAAVVAILYQEKAGTIDLTEFLDLWSGADILIQLAQGNYDLEVPDYAIDKHTREGRSLGKDTADFVTEGAHVENQSDLYQEPILRAIYEMRE